MNIPQKFIDACNDILAKLEGRILKYFGSLKTNDNVELYEHIKKIEDPKVEIIEGIAKLPNKKDGGWYEIPYKRKAKKKLKVNLQGMPFESLTIKILFPQPLFGPKNLLPRIQFSIDAPVIYPGSYGLVWEPLVGDMVMPKFHPYSTFSNRKEELLDYYQQEVVDLFCDILNRGDYEQVATLQATIKKIASNSYKNSFKYQKSYKFPVNCIDIPIYGDYDSNQDKHKIYVEAWAYGNPKGWITPQEVVLKFLYPLSAIISMFDEDGEFIDGATPAKIEDVKRDLRHISKRDKVRDRDYNPFAQKDRVKRDEFGFIIDKDKGEGLGTRDISTARKSLWEMQKEMKQKKEKQMESVGGANKKIIKYSSAKDFYKKNQSNRFTVKGNYSHLSFTEKNKIENVKSCNPPFILKFARDKLRLKMQVTSRKAIQILFEVYNDGYLVPI